MNVYRRFFRVTSGPCLETAIAVEASIREAQKMYAVILKKIGARMEYYHDKTNKICGLTFAEEPDKALYRERKQGGWWPKKNCKAGKEIITQLGEVKMMKEDDTLKTANLRGFPSGIFDNNAIHYATPILVPTEPPVLYITVPWFDTPTEEIEKYKKDREAKIHFSASMDSILWEPRPDMEEVKKWEMDRDIEQYNERLNMELTA